MKELKKNKGITLVALVITIIVLLILAGISISTIKGDNGIINNGYTAKEKTEIKEEMEIIGRAAIQAEGVSEGNITAKDVEEQCKKLKIEVTTNNDKEKIEVIVNSSKRIYTVEINGTVTGPYLVTDDTTPGELAGSGTELDPYKIQSIEDLVAFSNEVNNGKDFVGETVELTRDLDFKSILSYVDYTRTDFGDINGDGKVESLITELKSEKGFTAIGTMTNSFSGTLVGNNHTISNLYIYNENSYQGLFGYTKKQAIIKDISVTGNVSGGYNTGGIAGVMKGYITNCTNYATVKCIKNGEQYNDSIVGGVVGSTEGIGRITYCTNEGEVYGIGMDTGGVVGYLRDGGSAEYCYNKGKVEGKSTYVGGIVGGNTKGEVKQCINSGTIKGNNTVGGISGCAYNNTKIINCYNLGKVSGNDAVGGISGTCANSNGTIGTISNCYNIQIITGKSSVGVAVGYNNAGGKVMNCFGLNTLGREIIGGNLSTEVVDNSLKSEAEMKLDDFINLLNTGNDEQVWTKDINNINNGYPILKWQLE